MVRLQSSSLSPSSSPCLLSGNHSRRPEDNRRFWLQNQMSSSWGSAPAQLGLVRRASSAEHKHRAFPSLLQSLLAATGSLEQNMLPLSRYWLSSRVNKVLVICEFLAATSDFFDESLLFMWDEICVGIGWKANSLESWKVVAESMETRCCRVHGNFITFVGKLLPSPCWPKPLPSLHSILRSFIGLWVNIWHRNAHTSVPLPDSIGICRPYAVPLPDSIGIRHKCCFQNLYQICSILTQKNKTGSHRRTRHGGADLVETTHFAHLHTAYIWWRLGTWFYIWYHNSLSDTSKLDSKNLHNDII